MQKNRGSNRVPLSNSYLFVRFCTVCGFVSTLGLIVQTAQGNDQTPSQPITVTEPNRSPASSLDGSNSNRRTQSELKTAEQNETEDEVIEKKSNLATHMGWNDQDVQFKKPRQFRSPALNELTLEPSDKERSNN